MKKLILIFAVAALIFSSCTSPESVGRKAYKQYFKEVLKDPESLKIYDEEFSYPDASVIDITVDYGAKNGYGAMVRDTKHFKVNATVPKVMDVDGEFYMLKK